NLRRLVVALARSSIGTAALGGPGYPRGARGGAPGALLSALASRGIAADTAAGPDAKGRDPAAVLALVDRAEMVGCGHGCISFPCPTRSAVSLLSAARYPRQVKGSVGGYLPTKQRFTLARPAY